MKCIVRRTLVLPSRIWEPGEVVDLPEGEQVARVRANDHPYVGRTEADLKVGLYRWALMHCKFAPWKPLVWEEWEKLFGLKRESLTHLLRQLIREGEVAVETRRGQTYLFLRPVQWKNGGMVRGGSAPPGP